MMPTQPLLRLRLPLPEKIGHECIDQLARRPVEKSLQIALIAPPMMIHGHLNLAAIGPDQLSSLPILRIHPHLHHRRGRSRGL